MKSRIRAMAVSTSLVLAACTGYGALTGATSAQPAFGSSEDVSYATKLWNALVEAKPVGPETIRSYPYEGTPPHGDVLEFLMTDITIDGHTGVAVVKKNYYGDGIDDDVLEDPEKYLQSITVMFKREAGYDPEDWDSYRAKHTPDGKLMSNPKGLKLAGRVAKGLRKVASPATRRRKAAIWCTRRSGCNSRPAPRFAIGLSLPPPPKGDAPNSHWRSAVVFRPIRRRRCRSGWSSPRCHRRRERAPRGRCPRDRACA